MHPILFKIPGLEFSIHTYGLMVALAFLVGMWWATREAKIRGLDPRKISDLLFYIIISAIIGSRILHVLISERTRFLENPLIFFKIWEGGLVFYGGLIAALAVSIWFTRRHKMKFSIVADCFAPAIALGHAIGRLGCFCAGCCYGRAIGHDAWYAIKFPANISSFAPTGVYLYPTQLMEVFGELIIFGILLIVRKFQKFDGQLIGTYLMLYSILRAFNETYRGDLERGFVIEPWLSTSQFVSLFMFAIGASVYGLYFYRKYKND